MANKVIVRSFLVALVLGVVISLKGQNKATISFSSDKLTGVKLYKPIDGTFQYTVLSDIVDLKPNIKVSYDLEVDDFSCIRLLFPGIRIALILFPGDEVALKYTDNGEVLISGSNAEGHRYYNDSFISSGTMFYVDKIRYIAKNTPSVEKIAVEVDSVIIKEALDPLTILRNSNKISNDFYSLLSFDLKYYLYEEPVAVLSELSRNRYLSFKEVNAIEQQKGSLFAEINISNPAIIKLPLCNGIFEHYYRYEFDKLPDEEKWMLAKGYDAKTFGPYTPYLLRLIILGYQN